MASVDIYWFNISPFARSVVLFAKAANIEHQLHVIDLVKGEHNSETYLKINPAHQVPALKDGDFILTQSVAILQYLATKPGVADHWYPNDPQKRAKVNEYIQWHTTGELSRNNIFYKIVLEHHMFKKELKEDEIKTSIQNLNKQLDIIESRFLANTDFLAGNEISIADIYAACTLTQQMVTGLKLSTNRPKMAAWYERVKAKCAPHFEEIHAPLESFAEPVCKNFKYLFE